MSSFLSILFSNRSAQVRLSLAQQYFHLYRIDHIVGFFRIWAVPKGKPATKGSFDPKERDLWIPQGEKLLRMLLANSNMLPIGEDLGTVPSDVRDCLQRLVSLKLKNRSSRKLKLLSVACYSSMHINMVNN